MFRPVRPRTTKDIAVSQCEKRSNALKRSEEHTSELQSRLHLVCRLLLEKKKKIQRPVVLITVHMALPLYYIHITRLVKLPPHRTANLHLASLTDLVHTPE